jgi:hypothetical protein
MKPGRLRGSGKAACLVAHGGGIQILGPRSLV